MKITINCVCLACILIAYAPAAYANIINYSAIDTHRMPSVGLNISELGLTTIDQVKMLNAFNSDNSIDTMINLNADGSLAFLLDVNRNYVYFIHNEVRSTAPPATPVPEPGTMMLVGFGLMSASVFFRKHLKR
jgi:hypothetical protein